MVSVVRGEPSPADLQVVRELAARGLVVTVSQLESWRRAGLLPRHRRRGLGRGLGSVVDVVDPVVVESAVVLARHLRQGRDRRLAVLEWFAEAGRPSQEGAAVVPEPPMAAVRGALLWVLGRSVSHRLMEIARTAGVGEEGQDALYEAAGRLMGKRPYRAGPHPGAVRAAVLADEDIPAEAEGPDARGMVHLVAAIGLGAQEVGGDALAEAFAATGMFGLTVPDWADMLGAAERGEGPPIDWGRLQQHADVLGPVRRSDDRELLRARTVLIGLQGFYALYVFHGLLMPDTPALVALRQRIDDLGMGPVLGHAIALAPSPEQFASELALCMDPSFDGLYEVLMEQLAQSPEIFHIPGDDTGAAGFMDTWLRTLHEVTGKRQDAEDAGTSSARVDGLADGMGSAR